MIVLHISNHKQLDIHVRFWSGAEVHTRCLASVFMGHATAVDLKLEECLTKLRQRNLMHLSMGGATVN